MHRIALGKPVATLGQMTEPDQPLPDARSAVRPSAQKRRIIFRGLGVGLATAAYGISFGALAVAAGFTVWQTCFLSLVMFTGGSQFALIGVVAGGGLAAGPSAIAAAALLGIRNLIYGVRVSALVRPRGMARLVAPWLTIDESVAVAIGPAEANLGRLGFWVTGLAVFVGWNATTLIGAMLGDLFGDPRRYGLDAAATAAFLALLWPRLRSLTSGSLAVVAALIALLLTPVTQPGIPVLVGALTAAAAAIALRIRVRPSEGSTLTLDKVTTGAPTASPVNQNASE